MGLRVNNNEQEGRNSASGVSKGERLKGTPMKERMRQRKKQQVTEEGTVSEITEERVWND